jgi:hypothetical protein
MSEPVWDDPLVYWDDLVVTFDGDRLDATGGVLPMPLRRDQHGLVPYGDLVLALDTSTVVFVADDSRVLFVSEAGGTVANGG